MASQPPTVKKVKIRKNFFTVRVHGRSCEVHGNRVLRELVGCPNRGSAQNQAGRGFEHPPGRCVPSPGRGPWDQLIFKVRSNPLTSRGAVKSSDSQPCTP